MKLPSDWNSRQSPQAYGYQVHARVFSDLLNDTYPRRLSAFWHFLMRMQKTDSTTLPSKKDMQKTVEFLVGQSFPKISILARIRTFYPNVTA